MSRNLRMVEDQLNKGQAPPSVFGLSAADRTKPSDRPMPKEYQPNNVTPIRPAKPGDTPSVDFSIEALQGSVKDKGQK